MQYVTPPGTDVVLVPIATKGYELKKTGRYSHWALAVASMTTKSILIFDSYYKGIPADIGTTVRILFV